MKVQQIPLELAVTNFEPKIRQRSESDSVVAFMALSQVLQSDQFSSLINPRVSLGSSRLIPENSSTQEP